MGILQRISHRTMTPAMRTPPPQLRSRERQWHEGYMLYCERRRERRWGERAWEREWRPREREREAKGVNQRCAPREGVNRCQVCTDTGVFSPPFAQASQEEALEEVGREGTGEGVEAAREGAQGRGSESTMHAARGSESTQGVHADTGVFSPPRARGGPSC
jgi:hypothetical protein